MRRFLELLRPSVILEGFSVEPQIILEEVSGVLREFLSGVSRAFKKVPEVNEVAC